MTLTEFSLRNYMEMRRSMRYWWVNHNQTYKQAIVGSFLWAPKVRMNGRRSQSYDYLRDVQEGDVIFSYGGGTINAIGLAIRRARSAPRPLVGLDELENEVDGWLLPVIFTELANRIRPKDHLAELIRYFPTKYSPLQKSGNANQGIYLALISREFASVLMELMGGEFSIALNNLNEKTNTLDPAEDSEISARVTQVATTSTIYPHKPVSGKFHILTGQNGTGKTRYLHNLSAGVLDILPDRNSPYARMLCLSGTIYDKFPPAKKYAEDVYMYFGNKTNNNMFSEIAPFKQLPQFLLDKTRDRLPRYVRAGEVMSSIGFEPVLVLKFKRISEALDDNNLSEIDIRLFLDGGEISGNDNQNYWRNIVERFGFNGLGFVKNDVALELEDLSSGERLYILTILALCFCATDNSLVLFDEPENSLHPKWQAKLMRDIYSMVSELTQGTTVVVATHSPLVVSSAPNTNSLIRDLPSNELWLQSELFGRNSDSVLESHFGLMSPRSILVTSTIQECLRALVRINFEPDLFVQAADRLASLNIDFENSDPLFSTVAEISKIREAMK
jgi:ABC-type transport system involved in cytochrome c biogenesis ATPase subunit